MTQQRIASNENIEDADVTFVVPRHQHTDPTLLESVPFPPVARDNVAHEIGHIADPRSLNGATEPGRVCPVPGIYA